MVYHLFYKWSCDSKIPKFFYENSLAILLTKIFNIIYYISHSLLSIEHSPFQAQSAQDALGFYYASK